MPFRRVRFSARRKHDHRYDADERVEFFKVESHGRPRAGWEATRGKRTRIPGTVMAVSKGATFRSIGRRRTKPGRELIAHHRAELAGAEKPAGFRLARWEPGDKSQVAEALGRALRQWDQLTVGERLA